jgi:hypothetical protein
MPPVAIAVASVMHGVPTLSGTLLIMLSNDLAPADRLFVERHTVSAHRASEDASRHATRAAQLFEEGDWEGAAQEMEHAHDSESEAGDIPAAPLTIPVRRSLGDFAHDIGEKPGEAG